MKPAKRILTLGLALALCVQLLPAQALAHLREGAAEKPMEITTADGNTVAVEESWESLYPYGVFLFAEGETHVTEGGEAALIRLYRLGGTLGRATALVNYNPAIMQLEEDRLSYGNAAGSRDIRIEVEDPLPIAAYQPLGKPSEPVPTQARLTDSPYTGEDAQPGDHVLRVDAPAEGYQWYVLSEGRWQIVEGAAGGEFVVADEMLENYDFRCVLTQEGVSYCTDSLKGEVYVPEEEEELPAMPEELDLNPEKTFSTLETDQEDPYAGYVFAVTFADGEWVKEIRVTAPEDREAEALQFGTFTLIDHLGGDIFSGAATLTLSVTDNDDPEPFTIGFTAESYEADRSGGTAQLRLRRTGGTQTMVTVDYATQDGTAQAGRDYQFTTGTAAFYAGVDEAVIRVPLVDRECSEPLTFQVRLGEVKGDSQYLCTLDTTVAQVTVTGGGKRTGEPNLATLLYDAQAVDVSGSVQTAQQIAAPVGGGVLTGQAEEIPEENLLRAQIEDLDSPTVQGEGELMSYSYGRITFPYDSSGNYWGDEAHIAGTAKNDFTNWSGGSASGQGWQIQGRSPASATLNIPYMPQMYESFYGTFAFNAKLASSWTLLWYGMEYVYGSAGVIRKNGSYQSTVSSSPRIIKNGVEKEIQYTTGGSISTSWDLNSDVSGIKLWLAHYDAHDADDTVYSRITRGDLTRRVMNGDMSLRIHTANDGESGGGNVVTAPEGAAVLRSGTGVYNSMKPQVTVVPHGGGTDRRGKLYVGSRIRVSLSSTDSYKPYSGSVLNSALYLTRPDGSLVTGPQIEKSGSDFYITMAWEGMTEADLNTDYTINVVMTRVQELELDISPSVPRKPGADGSSHEIDTARIHEGWAALMGSTGNPNITLGYSETIAQEPHFSRQIKEKNVSLLDVQHDTRSPICSLGSYENLQYINFNRSSEDWIVYNGKQYRGNERIWLTVEDLAYGKLRFLCYSKAYLDAESTMAASVNRVELYFDGDGDGKISGVYNAATGYFNLSNGTADRFVMMLESNKSYNETTFQPEELPSGKFGEYYLKIFYTMTPRNLSTPQGKAEAKAQVLPAVTTSVTDQKVYSTLTEEQQSYRYLLSGIGEGGGRTSDGHPMYGVAANRVQFVDVPLGGDHRPVEHQGSETTGYTFHWEPEYHGNLLYPFSNPEPIYITHSLAGDSIPLAKIELNKEKSIVMDDKGRNNLNGYLGSFVADTTIALCVTEQTKTQDQLKADSKSIEALKPESTELIRRSAAPNASYLGQMQSGGMGESGIDPADSGDTYAEMLPNFGTDLPMRTFGLLGYATVMTNKDEVILSVSIPIASKARVNGEAGAARTFPETITAPQKKQWDEVSGFLKSIKDGGDITAVTDALKNNGHKAMEGGALKSKKLSATLSVTMVFSWKYDPVTNDYQFKEFAAGVVGSLAFKYTYRFAFFPLAYFYVSVNFSLTVTTGGSVVRTELERDTPYIRQYKPCPLQKGDVYGFYTKYPNIKIEFSGKIYVEVLDSRTATAPRSDTNNGYLRSKGGKITTIRLTNSKSMEFDSEKYIRITALEDSTTITYLNVIENSYSDLVWSGVKVAPKFSLEVGMGAGVEFLKIEACVKIVASATILFGKYNEKDGSRTGAVFQAAKFAISIVLRAVAFGFSAEMDAVGFTLSYADGTGWKKTYTTLGKSHDLDGGELQGEGDFLRPIQDFSGTQRIYSPTGADEASLLAFQPEDPEVPFHLSGYNSSVSAFRLADGLALGCDYQVIPVNGENYVLFTIGRENPTGSLDRTMLVLSRLVTTGGAGSVGLMNPLDPIHPTESDVMSPVPYIFVDTVEGRSGPQDDGTGDLEFQGYLDPDGKTIRVAWVSYDAPGDPEGVGSGQELLRAASQNTVVKTASFDTTRQTGFTPARVVSQRTGSRVSMPAPLGESVTAYVRGSAMTDEERAEALQTYRDALTAIGFDPDSPDPALSSIGKYRLSTQAALWDGAGQHSTLCVNANGRVRTLSLSDGQVIDNIAFTQVGDTYYAAFTTRDTHFPTTPGEGKNILTVRRLCLTAFTVSDTRVTWAYNGGFLLLRTLYDYEDNRAAEDGVYIDGRFTPCQEPYFANLQFLRGNLGNTLDGEPESFELMGDQEENFLLFEMNGCTYVVRQADLESITGPTHSGTILPFFAADTDFQGTAETGAASATGRTEVTIGADGEGGLAAVYVTTVPNTTNTALCMSKYDSITGTWGQGVMLAMNHMDVYEDSLREGWTQEEAQAAYLGQRENYPKGGMDQFTFTAPRIALGVRGSEDSGSAESSADHSAGSQTTLLVLTQGSWNSLRWEEANGERFLTIDPQSGGNTGIYALSYGVGSQTLGEASLSFPTRDFTAGAALHANLSFTNTGDVGIRGSRDRDQAITVTLTADGNGLPDTRLLSWTITENIVPGQKVALEGDFVLPVTLPEGAKFNLTVSEGHYYESQGGIPYTATLSGLLTVEGKPELGFESADFQLAGLSSGAVTLDDSGNVALDVDFLAGNRGNRDAEGVYVQFTCATGETDSEGNPIYRALDISRNTLEVGQEEPLLMSQQTGHDFSRGILFLDGLRTGYGRRVHGTVTLSPDQCFVGQSGLLSLRAELFSNADSQVTTDGRGVRQGVHGEYNEKNNLFRQNVEPVVCFTLPDQIFLPKDAIVRLPIRYLSATGSRTPLVQVAESPDKEDTSGKGYSRFLNMDQCLDLLYYEARSYSRGRGTGTIVVRAAKEGSGYIRVMDQTTNSYQDVLFTVTQENYGMYARPDNDRITFYNQDGSVYQPQEDQNRQSWRYEFAVDMDGKVPEQDAYRVIDGKVGSWFTFETEAESITLYLDGEAEISSDFPGFQPRKAIITDADTLKEYGKEFIHFGPNPDNRLHRVTVRVTDDYYYKGSTRFHRIVEHYSSDRTGSSPASPEQAPKLYWRENFPKKGSLTPGRGYHVYLNVVSATPLADVQVTSTDDYVFPFVSRQTDFWYEVDFFVRRNIPFTVDAVDRRGSHCVQEVSVDWWPSGVGLQGEYPTEAEEALWLDAEFVWDPGPALWVRIGENAPHEDVMLIAGDLDTIVWFAESEEELSWSDLMRLHLHFGTRGSEFLIPVDQDGLYVVSALCDDYEAEADDPEYAYEVIRADGTVEEYNALEEEDFNLLLLQVDGAEAPGAQPEPEEEDGGDDWSDLPLAPPPSEGTRRPDPAKSFSDVEENAWYYDSIRYALEKGIMQGNGNGTFAPNEVTDRAMIAQVLWNLEGRPACGQESPFADVESQAWYAPPVRWAAAQGIMDGTGENRFSPLGPLTREQLVTILYRYGQQKGLDTSQAASLAAYTDAGTVSPWAAEAMAWAVGAGLVKGKTPSTLNPADTATRAEVAAILMRYCETVAK